MKTDIKKELIAELFQKFENACDIFEGVEYWSFTQLQNVFNYSEWRNFIKVIDKAKVVRSYWGSNSRSFYLYQRNDRNGTGIKY